MKFIKSFESIKDNSNEYYITPVELDYLLTDITDLGWQVRTSFSKRLKQTETDENLYSQIRLEIIPFIEIKIFKIYNHNSLWIKNKEISDFLDSESFKEFIEVLKNRILEYELFLSKIFIQDAQIKIVINRRCDKELLS